MKKELPIYNAVITDEFDTGLFGISLVSAPAIERDLMLFSKAKEAVKFSVVNEQKQMIITPIMRCDYPIYRYSPMMGEYYIIYDRECIEKMAKKMLSMGTFKNWNLEHNCNDKVEGINLTQLFIKSSEKGIVPVGFDDIEEGTLFGVFAIDNDEVWNTILDGTFKGVSLEGMFDLVYSETDLVEEDEDITDDEFNEILSIIEQIGNRLNNNDI